jgi:ribosome-associated protein
MNQEPTAAAPALDRQSQLAAGRQFAIEAARLAANTMCRHVVVLDVSHISPVADYFVIATGTSARQMRTVADETDQLAIARSYRALARDGYEGASWILCDYVDVILHLFDDQARAYYDLDNLWGDAPRVAWQP